MMEENKIVIYQTEDGQTQIDVRLEGEMLWLNRQQLATLFDRDYKTISKHINNALKEELADSEVVAKFANNNRILYRPDGSKRIADNTLVALTLMIAESKTEEKDVMVKVVVNLINQQN